MRLCRVSPRAANEREVVSESDEECRAESGEESPSPPRIPRLSSPIRHPREARGVSACVEEVEERTETGEV